MLNNELNKAYQESGIDQKVLDYCSQIEKDLMQRFYEIDKIAEFNQLKVVKAMQDNRLSDIHFAATTGYGYNDMGRETLEKVYA
ncbi:MAG: methionine gamma-lyase family protein, partial [Mobilitalea sp.]